jgi:hypothetical protein
MFKSEIPADSDSLTIDLFSQPPHFSWDYLVFCEVLGSHTWHSIVSHDFSISTFNEPLSHPQLYWVEPS